MSPRRAAALAAVAALSLTAAVVRAQGGGTTCLACVAIVGLLEQMGGNSSAPAPEATCKQLGVCDGTCTLFKKWPTPAITFPTDGGVVDSRRRLADGLAGARPPTLEDVAAFLAELRAAEDELATAGGRYPPTMPSVLTAFLRRHAARALADTSPPLRASAACDGGFNLTCEISRVFDEHLPLVDGDNDTFAGPSAAADSPFLSAHFRGTDWRGRDCDDTDAGAYPGRASDGDAARDSNCNGIVGVEPGSGVPYETLFCSGADAPMGVAILGDSAAAHFHLPAQYVNALAFNLSGALELAANEADWPQCSWATGFRNSAPGPSRCPAVGLVPPEPGSNPWPAGASLYERFATLNRCNHRDYQNLGVNGARVGSMAPSADGGFGIVDALARNRATDAPLLVVYALIGNDVCNGHPGAGSMTTVPEFTAAVLASLAVLNATLPAGSHVAFLGLVDGRVLYNTTSPHLHPIGVPYPDLYDALSCTGSNPCWGWLNSNATWRDFTSERAANLTASYDAIIANASALNLRFDMYRLNVDWVALLAKYVAAGGIELDCIEAGDGFHPSQTGHALLAGQVWEDLTANRPQWLPRLNPSNANITALFGDQGGY